MSLVPRVRETVNTPDIRHHPPHKNYKEKRSFIVKFLDLSIYEMPMILPIPFLHRDEAPVPTVQSIANYPEQVALLHGRKQLHLRRKPTNFAKPVLIVRNLEYFLIHRLS
jgi:hypothetical protein